MKLKKCKICKKRPADTRHAKDYNHKSIKMPGNCARLCKYCHTALHQLNEKNNLDWDYMIRTKRKEIIELAELLEKKARRKINNPLGKKAGADSWNENLESSAPARIKKGGI